MGRFAQLVKNKNAHIPEEKRQEFLSRITELFDRGGMMDVTQFTLYGKNYNALKRIYEIPDGIYFYYNYFDDDTSESAGFNTKDFRVCSRKLVGGNFWNVMLAAYSLEGLYNTGINAVDANGDWISGYAYVGWINYLFNENFTNKTKDPWEIYLTLKDVESEEYLQPKYFRYFQYSHLGFLGYLDLMAVFDGTDAVREYLNAEKDKYESDDEYDYRSWRCKIFEGIVEDIQNFVKTSPLEAEEQPRYLVNMLYDLYALDFSVDGYEKYDKNDIYMKSFVYSSPATIIKLIAETYKKDFWELWNEVAAVAKRSLDSENGKVVEAIKPISTEDFFDITTDDLILFWTNDNQLTFSSEMEKWFVELKTDYEEIIKFGVDMDKPLRRVQKIMDFAEETYTHIYLFNSFLDETMDNIASQDFMALWILFDKILHDENNIEANKVLFRPGWGYSDEEDYAEKRHRVVDSWWFAGRENKFNPGRRKVRQYIALMGNKELRKKVLGI